LNEGCEEEEIANVEVDGLSIRSFVPHPNGMREEEEYKEQ